MRERVTNNDLQIFACKILVGLGGHDLTHVTKIPSQESNEFDDIENLLGKRRFTVI